jgi:TP901 family phage tail tape measure protein
MPQYVGQVYVGVSFDTAAAGQALNRSLTTAAGQAGDAMNRTMSDRMLQMGTQFTRVGRQMSFGLSAPLLALGHAADSAFTSFDTQMTKVAALTGTGIEQTNAWSDQVLDLAANYGQTGEDAASALYLITSSGIKGAEAMATLDVVGKAAAVGLGDMATIAGLLTSAMNAYGTETLSAAKAADILTGAVQESKVPADQLAGSISQLLPIASQLGIGFDQVVGSMAALSLQGTNAAMGATQLRGILNGMLDPSTQAAQALGKVGLSVQDIQKTMESKGIVAGVRQIRDAIVANGGESDEALAAVFGNVRALTGVFGLLNDTGGKVDRVLNNTTNSANKLNAAFLVTADTAGFKAKQASAELSAEMTKLGQNITPIKTLFAQVAGTALQVFNSLGPLKPVLVLIGAGLAVAGPLLYTVGAGFDVMAGFAELSARATARAAGSTTAMAGASQAAAAAAGEQAVATEAAAAATETEVVAVEQLELALGTTEAEMVQLGLFSEATMGSMVVGTEGATAATAELTAAEAAATTGAASMGAAMLAALLPVAAVAATIGAAIFVWNKRMEQADSRANELGDIFKNKVAGQGIEGANETIGKTEEQIKSLRAEADSLHMPWDADTREELNKGALALENNVKATQQNIKWTDELSQKTAQNKDVTFQWLQAQTNAGTVFNSTEEAYTAFAAAVLKGGGQISAAATAEGQLADKAKDLASGFFGLHDANEAFQDSLRKVQDAQQGVTDAEKAATNARRDVATAIRGVTDAQQSHRDALLKVADAQRELTDARTKYNELLKGPTHDEQLDIRQAQLGLRRAQQALRTPSKDPLDRQQAQLDLIRARDTLAEARGAHDKNLIKARADVTTAEKNVASAQKDVVTSAQAIVTAQQGVIDANDKVVAANKAVEDAHRKVETATWDSVRAASDLNQKQGEFDTLVHNSSTHLDPFLQYLEMLKTKYPEVAKSLDPLIEQVGLLNLAAQPPPVQETDPNKIAWRQRLLNRASGGPVGAGQLSTVNEAGVPELWSQGGKQYLLPLKAGKVIPLDAGTVKGGDGISVGDINVYGAGQPVQTAYEVRRQLRVKTRTKGRI